MVITSKDNETIKHIKKLKEKKYREEYNEFIIEGTKMIEEAIAENANIKSIIICDDCKTQGAISNELMYEIAKKKCIYVDDKIFNTITDVINQNPGGFSGIDSPLFFSNPTTQERNLANRVLKGEYYYPATNALWFYAPGNNTNCKATWYEQRNSGRYKNHCFYEPDPNICDKIH